MCYKNEATKVHASSWLLKWEEEIVHFREGQRTRSVGSHLHTHLNLGGFTDWQYQSKLFSNIVSWTFYINKSVCCISEFWVRRPWELTLQLPGTMQTGCVFRDAHTAVLYICTLLCKFKICPEIRGQSKMKSPVRVSACVKTLLIHKMCKTFKWISSLRFFSS